MGLYLIRPLNFDTSTFTLRIFTQQKVGIFLKLEETNACARLVFFMQRRSTSCRHGATGVIEIEKVKTTIQETLAS